MQGFTANIARDANMIDDEIRKARRQLETMIGNAREFLEALDVVVQDGVAELDGLRGVEMGMTGAVAAKRVQDYGDEEKSREGKRGRREGGHQTTTPPSTAAELLLQRVATHPIERRRREA